MVLRHEQVMKSKLFAVVEGSLSVTMCFTRFPCVKVALLLHTFCFMYVCISGLGLLHTFVSMCEIDYFSFLSFWLCFPVFLLHFFSCDRH